MHAVKILDKRHIIREKKVQYVSREKEVLTAIDHPFFVKLFFTFQDTDNLCILNELLEIFVVMVVGGRGGGGGGELILGRLGRDEEGEKGSPALLSLSLSFTHYSLHILTQDSKAFQSHVETMCP